MKTRLSPIFRLIKGRAFCAEVGDGQRVEQRLTEVGPLSPAGSSPRALRCGSFSLVFTSAPEARFSQRIYALEQAQLGQLQIFLVPIGIGRYEAAFN